MMVVVEEEGHVDLVHYYHYYYYLQMLLCQRYIDYCLDKVETGQVELKVMLVIVR